MKIVGIKARIFSLFLIMFSSMSSFSLEMQAEKNSPWEMISPEVNIGSGVESHLSDLLSIELSRVSEATRPIEKNTHLDSRMSFAPTLSDINFNFTDIRGFHVFDRYFSSFQK